MYIPITIFSVNCTLCLLPLWMSESQAQCSLLYYSSSHSKEAEEPMAKSAGCFVGSSFCTLHIHETLEVLRR